MPNRPYCKDICCRIKEFFVGNGFIHSAPFRDEHGWLNGKIPQIIVRPSPFIELRIETGCFGMHKCIPYERIQGFTIQRTAFKIAVFRNGSIHSLRMIRRFSIQNILHKKEKNHGLTKKGMDLSGHRRGGLCRGGQL